MRRVLFRSIIRDLWRIKKNEVAVEIHEVNFSEVIDEAIFSVQETLDGKPVTIEKVLPDAFPKIKADLTKVNQILFFLLDNAETGRASCRDRV